MGEKLKRNDRIVALVVSALALFATGSTHAAPAAEAAGDDGEGGFQEYVEVNTTHLPESSAIATKLHVPLRLTPANVGTVGAELMREQQSITLGDALRNVSGLNIQPGAGVFEYFVIRGFDAESSGLVMIDGAPEPESSFVHLYNAAGVELFKGPGGFLYGKDPLAGVINIVRKQPLPSDFAVFSGRLGSFGAREGAIDWNSSTDDGRVSFRLNGVYREADNYRDDQESRHIAINPGVRFELGDSSVLNVNLEFVDAEYQPDSGLPLFFATGPGDPTPRVPEVPRERSYQTPFDFSEQEVTRAQVDFEHEINDRLTLRTKTYLRTLDWDTAGTLLIGAFPDGFGGTVVSRSLTTLADEQRFVGTQVELLAELGSGRVRHRLLAGVEFTRLDDEYAIGVMVPQGSGSGLPELAGIGLDNPVETATGLAAAPFTGGDTSYETVAPYVIDQISVPGNVELLLGARYDSIDFEGDFSQFGVPLPGTVTRDDDDVSPMLGVLWAPSERLSIYANAASSFAPASPRIIDDFAPQEGDQVEFGVKRSFLDDRLRATASVFRLDRENIGIADATGVTQRAGDQRSDGFELELAAEPSSDLRLFFSYAFVDAELTEYLEPNPSNPFAPPSDFSGNDPAFAPEHLANFWISKQFDGRLGIGGGFRYIGEQFVDEDNIFVNDDALLLDAAVFYDFPDWRLKLNLSNLTDEDYFVRGFGGTSVIPASPFAIQAGFEFRLQ